MTRRGFFGIAAGVVALDPCEAIIPPHRFEVKAGRKYGMSALADANLHMDRFAEEVIAALERRRFASLADTGSARFARERVARG